MSVRLDMHIDDTAPLPTFTLYDAAGIADLSSGASVRFILTTTTGGYVTAEDATFVAGASSAGQVTLSAWTTAANASTGDYWARFPVTWTDGTITSFPNHTGLPVRFHAVGTTSS